MLDVVCERHKERVYIFVFEGNERRPRDLVVVHRVDPMPCSLPVMADGEVLPFMVEGELLPFTEIKKILEGGKIID